MGQLDSLIPFYAAQEAFGDDKEVARRSTLKVYAETMAGFASKSLITDCAAFSLIVEHASLNIPTAVGTTAFLEVMLDDLRSVLIGRGYSRSERNTGRYALRPNAFRDTGFKKQFQDGGNQVQHAMAGIYISFIHGWLAERYLLLQEDGTEDLVLYHATFEIASHLTPSNFKSLPQSIRSVLGA